jgi:peptide chain release factor subunit 1
MYSARFRQLLGEPGPFTSVYFDGSAEADDTAVALALKWRGLRDNLEQCGADASITAEIEHAVMHLPPPGGRGGRAVIASATGVVLNEYLLRPAARSVVRVSELPYIVPILEHGVEHTRYLLVVADPHGAFITRHTDFTRSSEAIEAEGDGGPTPRPVADRVGELVRNTPCGAVFLVGDADTAGRRGAAAVGDFRGSVRGPHRRADRPGRRSRCPASLPGEAAAASSPAGGSGATPPLSGNACPTISVI